MMFNYTKNVRMYTPNTPTVIDLPEPTFKTVLCGLLMTFITVVIFFCSS